MGELLGYRVLGPMEQMNLPTGSEEARTEARRREEEARVQRVRRDVYAKVVHMLGVNVGDMTEGQHQFARTLEERSLGKSTSLRGYGFSMPDVDQRRPNTR